MTNLPAVAFIGKAGSGKTTCADILIERFGYERLSFAEPLKIGCDTRDDRGLLQRVGQGVRDLYPDFWVNLALAEMAQRESVPNFLDNGMPGYGRRFVVDDCRYENEATALAVAGFVMVRVVVPTATRVARLKGNGRLQDEAQLSHVSETELDDFQPHFRIINDGADERALVEKLTNILNWRRV